MNYSSTDCQPKLQFCTYFMYIHVIININIFFAYSKYVFTFNLDYVIHLTVLINRISIVHIEHKNICIQAFALTTIGTFRTNIYDNFKWKCWQHWDLTPVKWAFLDRSTPLGSADCDDTKLPYISTVYMLEMTRFPCQAPHTLLRRQVSVEAAAVVVEAFKRETIDWEIMALHIWFLRFSLRFMISTPHIHPFY